MRRGRVLLMSVAISVASGCATVTVPEPPPGDPLARFAHDDWNGFLERHVDDAGRVDYAAAETDREDLGRYVAAIAHQSPDATPPRFPTDADRLAYWINAYNASTISLVLDRYPVGSVHEIQTGFTRLLRPILPAGAGFFFFHRIQLGGARTSLYFLENGVIRERFDEPRIHFALNCASISCPRLPSTAFRVESLEADLARETQHFLAEERNVAIDPEAGVVRLSSIFDWYAKDFTGWMERHAPEEPATLLGWVTHHAEGAKRQQLLDCAECRVEFVTYDWGLNDLTR